MENVVVYLFAALGICLGGTDFTLHSPSDFRSSNHSATVVQNCPKCNSTAECQDSGAVCIETILSLPGCEQNSLPSEGYCQCAEHLLYKCNKVAECHQYYGNATRLACRKPKACSRPKKYHGFCKVL